MATYSNVDHFYERQIGDRLYCTLPGGYDDEAQWCYENGTTWTTEDRLPIEAVLTRRMSNMSKVYWRLWKHDGIYGALKRHWQASGLIASSASELAQILDKWYAEGGH